MKKFLRIFLIIAMICLITVTLTGCGDEEETTSSKKSSKKAKTEDVEEVDEEEDEKEEEIVNSQEISMGEWSGNTYTNDFIGITYKMPSTWKKSSDEEISKLMEVGESLLNADQQALIDQAEDSGLYCMVANDPNTGASVTVLIEKTPITVTEEFYLTSVKTQLEAVDSINYEVGDVYNTRLGSVKFAAIDADAELSGITLGQSYLAKSIGNYVACAIITTTQDGQLEEILDCFE